MQELLGARENLSGHTEGNEDFNHFLKVASTGNQEVFMAAIRLASRIGVVLEEKDFAPNALVSKTFFRRANQAL